MTYSIVALDPTTRELGVAIATRRTAVGARVVLPIAGVGAVSSQAISNPWLGSIVLQLLSLGVPARGALEGALATDPSPQRRQLHLVDASGKAECWTGRDAPDWKGSVQGEGFSIAGNHLAGPAVVAAMGDAFTGSSGDLADRLLRALMAGEAAGGDARGKQSAALIVVKDEPFPLLNLRVDDDVNPLNRLERILEQYRTERLMPRPPRSAYLKE